MKHLPLLFSIFILSVALPAASLAHWGKTSGGRHFSSSSRSHSSASSKASRSSSSISSPSGSSARAWGAYVGDKTTDAASFESLVGKKMKLQAIFVGDSDSFPSEFGPTVRDQGKTLVIFWEPTASLDSILAGSDDALLKQFVAGAKAYGGPVIFVPFHEMNGNWDSWDGTVGSNTPQKLISAWRHVHDLFTGSNVKFGWAVNSDSVPATAQNALGAYYPGDAYVDIVGEDAFNFGNPWQSFLTVAGPALAQLRSYNKPVYLFSIASCPGSQKAQWITDALSANVAGWIAFSIDKECDWRVNSDPLSLQAFKAGLPN